MDAQRPVGDLGGRGDLAPAGDALVGRHLDEQVLAPVGAAGLDQPGLDAGDLHVIAFSPVEMTLASKLAV